MFELIDLEIITKNKEYKIYDSSMILYKIIMFKV